MLSLLNQQRKTSSRGDVITTCLYEGDVITTYLYEGDAITTCLYKGDVITTCLYEGDAITTCLYDVDAITTCLYEGDVITTCLYEGDVITTCLYDGDSITTCLYEGDVITTCLRCNYNVFDEGDVITTCLYEGDVITTCLYDGDAIKTCLYEGDVITTCLYEGDAITTCLYEGDAITTCLYEGDVITMCLYEGDVITTCLYEGYVITTCLYEGDVFTTCFNIRRYTRYENLFFFKRKDRIILYFKFDQRDILKSWGVASAKRHIPLRLRLETKRDRGQIGEVDRFSIDSEVNMSEVQRIELRRDNCGLYSNWYLDWIEVTNKKNSITFIFPAMKWIKANGRYFFNHHTCLPQDDLFLETRKLELQTMQAEYQLQVKTKPDMAGLPAQVKTLPEDEKFSFHYEANFALEGITLKAESFKLTLMNKCEWQDFEDVKTVYTKAFGVPESSKYFNDDAHFGRQRLSSLNSLLIELCTTIPQKFGVTEDMIKPFLEGKTMSQAMDGKKLFIVDLAILEGCPTKHDYLVVSMKQLKVACF
ncbi:ALOX5 [Mytilus edulis]|uniref:ALOX5 n=1 Tax=Mytilus edulis TaxID=6550 RepID=A0A8S3TWG0_MYTED|nr:ALOX5 [Mytilus edulis]